MIIGAFQVPYMYYLGGFGARSQRRDLMNFLWPQLELILISLCDRFTIQLNIIFFLLDLRQVIFVSLLLLFETSVDHLDYLWVLCWSQRELANILERCSLLPASWERKYIPRRGILFLIFFTCWISLSSGLRNSHHLLLGIFRLVLLMMTLLEVVVIFMALGTWIDLPGFLNSVGLTQCVLQLTIFDLAVILFRNRCRPSSLELRQDLKLPTLWVEAE
jgi:hypothetical protein